MQEFQFAIGEIVALRVALAEASLGKTPVPFQVLEHRRQTCPGGEQLHYLLRWGKEHALFLELELVGWDSNETKAAIARGLDENDERARRRWETGRERAKERAEQAEQAEQEKLKRSQDAGE